MPDDAYIRQYTNHYWFRQWLVAWSAPSLYLNQCCDIWIGLWGTDKIHTFSFKEMDLKMSSVWWRPIFLGFIVLKLWISILSCHMHGYCMIADGKIHMRINNTQQSHFPDRFDYISLIQPTIQWHYRLVTLNFKQTPSCDKILECMYFIMHFRIVYKGMNLKLS